MGTWAGIQQTMHLKAHHQLCCEEFTQGCQWKNKKGTLPHLTNCLENKSKLIVRSTLSSLMCHHQVKKLCQQWVCEIIGISRPSPISLQLELDKHL